MRVVSGWDISAGSIMCSCSISACDVSGGCGATAVTAGRGVGSRCSDCCCGTAAALGARLADERSGGGGGAMDCGAGAGAGDSRAPGTSRPAGSPAATTCCTVAGCAAAAPANPSKPLVRGRLASGLLKPLASAPESRTCLPCALSVCVHMRLYQGGSAGQRVQKVYLVDDDGDDKGGSALKTKTPATS